MPKIDKLLILLELLGNRQVVSVSEIMEACHITERTVFRYLNTLADANFPYEYDYDLGGYRLLGKRNLLAQFSDSEMAVLYYGTLLLEQFAGKSALDSIKSARVKLESRLSKKLQQMLDAGREMMLGASQTGGLTDLVVMSMLLLASRQGAAVKVNYIDVGGDTQELLINRPKIIYDREWLVGEESGPSGQVRVPIRQIQDINLGSLKEAPRRARAS